MVAAATTLRSAYAQQFKAGVVRNSRLAAAGLVATHLGAVLLTTFASYQLWVAGSFVGSVGYVFAVLFIGTRFRAFGDMVHECAHNGLTRRRLDNVLIGRLLSIPLFYSFDEYKRHHLTHHAFTGDLDRDLEFGKMRTYGFHEPLDRNRLKRHLLRIFTPSFFSNYLGGTLVRAGDPFWCNLGRIMYTSGLLAGGSVFGASGTLVVLGYVAVPYLFALPLLAYATDILDHAGLLANREELDRTRNYCIGLDGALGWIVHLILFPRNDSYHLVHHLFPNIPVGLLPACHRQLMQNPIYRRRNHTLRAWTRQMLSTSWHHADGSSDDPAEPPSQIPSAHRAKSYPHATNPEDPHAS